MAAGVFDVTISPVDARANGINEQIFLGTTIPN
jgi:hypothetical protein